MMPSIPAFGGAGPMPGDMPMGMPGEGMAEDQGGEMEYQVEPGDTWESIAVKLYGDPAASSDLQAANPEMMQPQEGDILALPYPPTEQQDVQAPGDGDIAALMGMMGGGAAPAAGGGGLPPFAGPMGG